MIPKEILKKIRRIEIRTSRLVNDLMAGEYQSTFKGHGMEFDEVREYQPGDEVRSIDWNVTARIGRPFIKRFVEERELTVMLMVDASQSGEFGSGSRLKRELAAELCSVLAFAAIKNNDKVGLMVFTDRVERYIPPKKGRRHVLRVVHEVLSFKPQGHRTRIASALEYLSSVQKRRTVAFLISDFLGSDFERSLEIANKRHDVIALSVEDPRESEMPDVGIVVLQDAETAEMRVLDTHDAQTQKLFKTQRLKFRSELDRVLRRTDVDEVRIRTDRNYTEPLMRFFRSRERLR